MKKGNKIDKVEISKGYVSAIKADGTMAKLSRQERKVLANYRVSDYEKQIKRIFSNPDILTDSFTVVEDGVVKYRTYTIE